MLNLAKGQPVDILIRKLCKSLVTLDKKKMRVIDLQSVRLISSKKKLPAGKSRLSVSKTM